jgi:hypothetical protein
VFEAHADITLIVVISDPLRLSGHGSSCLRQRIRDDYGSVRRPHRRRENNHPRCGQGHCRPDREQRIWQLHGDPVFFTLLNVAEI